MELREGYKQTEVGMIPDDWEVFLLARVCSKITDGTHDTPKPINPGVPFLTAIHVKENKIDFNDCYYLPQKIHDEIYKRCNPERNDVLMVNIGAGVATTSLVNVDYEFSLKNVALLKPEKSKLIGSYLNYYQSIVKNKITESISTGGAQPFLSLTQIGQLKIALPPTKTEQTAIANALSDADALIQSLTRLIAKKRQIKQGAMQTLLNPYENGRLKAGWVVKKLGDVLESTQLGGNYANSEDETDFPLIKMGNMWRGKINLIKIEYVKPGIEVADRDLLKKGDVLFNTRNTLELVGKVSIWRDELSKAYFNSNIMRLKFKRSFVSSNTYMNETLNQQRQIQQLKGLATGTTSVAAIYTRDLIGLEIPLAPKDEQTRIATILSDMDADITALETKLSKTQQIKQGMMQNLLTGRIRLL